MSGYPLPTITITLAPRLVASFTLAHPTLAAGLDQCVAGMMVSLPSARLAHRHHVGQGGQHQ
jgi:hypothetical protein